MNDPSTSGTGNPLAPSGIIAGPSVNSPAGDEAGWSPSDTSGNETITCAADTGVHIDETTAPRYDAEGSTTQALSDVLYGAIACPTASTTLTDQGYTVVGGGQSPPSSGGQPDVAPANDGATTNPWVIAGTVRVGVMTAPREEFEVHKSPDLRALLQRTDLSPDSVIEVAAETAVSVVDLDTHHWPAPPDREELLAHLAAIHPEPDASWISHGHGLKLIYAGTDAECRALAAAFSVPPCFEVELLRHTRHPGASSSKHGGLCDALAFAESAGEQYEFHAVGNLTADQRERALAELGLEDGKRYDHDRCPLAPGVDSDAKSCVRVLDGGVYCHRCASHGVTHKAGVKPGYWPFSATAGSPATHLAALADSRVHWTHARLVLKHHYPHLGEAILRKGYARSLGARYGDDDPRVPRVFNPDLDIVWGEAGWLDASNYRPTRIDNDVVDGLPYALKTLRRSDGTRQAKVDTARRSQVKNRKPDGYTPLRPYRGITFDVADGAIPVRTDSDREHPIELLDEPLPEAEAWEALEAAFPQLNRLYLKACISAVICGEACEGRPPMLACTGPSGSGKEVTIRLAASFLGDEVRQLPLTQDEEKFARNVGAELAAGHRFLVFDELSKTPRLVEKVKPLLAISTQVTWRPLYANGTVATPFRGAVFFPVTYLPDFIRQSPEFNRRVRHIRLYHKVLDWQQSSGGDAAQWRDRNAENARIANSVLTHTWRHCLEE